MAVQPLSPEDLAVALRAMELIGPVSATDVTNAICSAPQLERTIDGASTLSFDVADHRRELTRGEDFKTRSFAVVDGVHFEMVKVRKSRDKVNLTFEDAVVAALRRRTDPRTFAAGSATRQTIAAALAAEAGVRIDVDPTARPVVADAVERSADGDVSNSWDILGPLAEDIDWRRFSDGAGLLFGSDDWLMNRLPAITIREFSGGVHNIDFDLDVGKPASTATADVDVDTWTLPPGLAVDITDLGPADGRWLIERYSRPLTRTRGTLSLVRGQASLMEPPPSERGGNDADGEAGEADFLPGTAAVKDPDARRVSARAAEAAGDNSGLGRMVTWARAQQGKKYLWGASGPNAYDCSGFLQQAAAAGGLRLPKPCSSQLSQCQRGAARMVSVSTALNTYGAVLFRVDMEGQATDHVAISLGDNDRTVEARGTAQGCGIFRSAPGRRWNYGAVLNFASKVSTTRSYSGPK